MHCKHVGSKDYQRDYNVHYAFILPFDVVPYFKSLVMSLTGNLLWPKIVFPEWCFVVNFSFKILCCNKGKLWWCVNRNVHLVESWEYLFRYLYKILFKKFFISNWLSGISGRSNWMCRLSRVPTLSDIIVICFQIFHIVPHCLYAF